MYLSIDAPQSNRQYRGTLLSSHLTPMLLLSKPMKPYWHMILDTLLQSVKRSGKREDHSI